MNSIDLARYRQMVHTHKDTPKYTHTCITCLCKYSGIYLYSFALPVCVCAVDTAVASVCIVCKMLPETDRTTWVHCARGAGVFMTITSQQQSKD